MVVLILLLLEHKSDKRKFALAIVLTGAVTMNHTVSIIFITAILLLVYLLHRFLLKEARLQNGSNVAKLAQRLNARRLIA